MALAALIPPPRRREYGSLYGSVSRERSPAIVALPAAIMVLSMAFAAAHYRTYLAVTRSLEEGARLRTAHQDGQALRLAEQAARQWPTDEGPHFRNPEQALDHARRAVELSRWKEPEYIDTLAEALYLNKQYAEAVRVQARALELVPNNPEYQDHMARYRKAAGA